MTKILYTVLALFVTVALSAQFTDRPGKIQLGYQTTANGLVCLVDSIPAFTPSDQNDCYLAQDTTANKIYIYKPSLASWEEFSSGIALIDSIENVLITSPITGQVLRFDGTQWINSTERDTSDTNEIQYLVFSGDTLSLTDDPTSVILPYLEQSEISSIISDSISTIVIDSTRLIQDSIIVYYQDGSEIGRDTLSLATPETDPIYAADSTQLKADILANSGLTLQQVTDNGNITNNTLLVNASDGSSDVWLIEGAGNNFGIGMSYTHSTNIGAIGSVNFSTFNPMIDLPLGRQYVRFKSPITFGSNIFGADENVITISNINNNADPANIRFFTPGSKDFQISSELNNVKFNILTDSTKTTLDTTVLTIDKNNKRIGLFTTTPSYKLDVNGNGRFTDRLYLETIDEDNTNTSLLAADPVTGEVEERTVASLNSANTLQSVTDNGNTTTNDLIIYKTDSLTFNNNGLYYLEDISFAKGVGYQLGLNNTGANFSGGAGYQLGYQNTGVNSSGGAGYQLGYQNTGDNFSGGAGYQLGLNNTGASFSGGAGRELGYQNTGASFSGGAGYRLGYENTGVNFSGGAGVALGRDNTGANFSGGAGVELGLGNSGTNFSGGAGYRLGFRNSGANFSGGAGYELGYENTGFGFAGGVGLQLGYQNTGNSFAGGAGYQLGYANTGDSFSGGAGRGLGFQNTGSNFSGTGYLSSQYNNAANIQLLGANITTNTTETTITPTGYDYTNNRVGGDFSAITTNRVVNFRENGAGAWRRFTVMSADSAQLNYSITSPTTFNVVFPSLLTDMTAIGEGVDLVQSNTIILGEGEDVGINTNTPDAKLHVAGNMIIESITEDNTNTSLLAADPVTGEVEERTLSSIVGSGAVNNTSTSHIPYWDGNSWENTNITKDGSVITASGLTIQSAIINTNSGLIGGVNISGTTIRNTSGNLLLGNYVGYPTGAYFSAANNGVGGNAIASFSTSSNSGAKFAVQDQYSFDEKFLVNDTTTISKVKLGINTTPLHWLSVNGDALITDTLHIQKTINSDSTATEINDSTRFYVEQLGVFKEARADSLKNYFGGSEINIAVLNTDTSLTTALTSHDEVYVLASVNNSSASEDVDITLPNPSATYAFKKVYVTNFIYNGATYGVNVTSGTDLIIQGNATKTTVSDRNINLICLQDNFGGYYWREF